MLNMWSHWLWEIRGGPFTQVSIPTLYQITSILLGTTPQPLRGNATHVFNAAWHSAGMGLHWR